MGFRRLALDPKQEAFCQYLASGMNCIDAWIRAGYRRSHSRPYEALDRPAIKARVQQLIAAKVKREERANEIAAQNLAITKERVATELAKIGFANMADYTRLVGPERVVDLSQTDRDQLAAVQELTVEDYTTGRGKNAREVRKVKLKLADKRAALMDLAKLFGWIVERHEHGGPHEFDKLSVEEIDERLVAELTAAGCPEALARTLVSAPPGGRA